MPDTHEPSDITGPATGSAERVRSFIEHSLAIHAVRAAETLAKYLARVRPDLESSIADIRGLGAAIQRSIPAITPGEFGTPIESFRHGVCLVDSTGRHRRRDHASEELAAELLVEYGEARGGAPVDWEVRSEDYGNNTYYMMSFIGGPTEPTHETRLTQAPRTGSMVLQGMEERWPHSNS